jgi:hypothetical protein
VAALELGIFPAPGPRTLPQPQQYSPHQQPQPIVSYLTCRPSILPSHHRLQGGDSQLERGRNRPCVGLQLQLNGDSEPMSENPLASSSPAQQQRRSLLEDAVTAVGHQHQQESQQKHQRQQEQQQQIAGAVTDQNVGGSSPKPGAWRHLSPLADPRPEPSLPRSLGVHNILNPLETAAASAPVRQSSREVPDVSLSSASSHQRQSQSPIARFTNPNTQHLQGDHPSLSPGVRPRRIITPISPAARLASTVGKTIPGKINVAQSPFVQEPSTGLYNVSPPNVPLLTEPTVTPSVALPGPPRLPPSQPSRHSTPTFHSRRTSAGLQTNPSSQDTSPSTPRSSYSQFGQSSPSAGLLQLPGPSSLEPPLFPAADSLNRLPGGISGPKYGGEELPLTGMPRESIAYPGMIPVVVDLKSGSRSQAEKRKANSDASRRFRNRKKNELALEQKLKSVTEELRIIAEERDYYRTERDFIRDQFGRTVGLAQLPNRPPSPRHFRSAILSSGNDPGRDPWRSGEGVSSSAAGSPSTSSTGPLSQSGMPSTPHPSADTSVTLNVEASPYPAPTQGDGLSIAQDEGQLQPRPVYQSTWASGPTSGDMTGGQTRRQHPSYRSSSLDPQHQKDLYERSWSRP